MKKFIENLLLLFVCSKRKRRELRNSFLLKREKYENNNEVIMVAPDGTRKNVFFVKGLNVEFNGKNSKIEIYEPCDFANVHIQMSDNSVARFGKGGNINHMIVTYMNNAVLTVGEGLTCVGCRICLHDEAYNRVEIGDDCMFSYDIVLWPSDGHALYDAQSQKIINKPQKGIKIGSHVWLGRAVSVLKDVEIADNVTVGACSLVNKSIEESNVVAAGVPAKIVKHHVNWKRDNTDSFPGVVAV